MTEQQAEYRTATIRPFADQGNFTQIHNFVFDELMPKMDGTTFKVLMFIIRKTVGWGSEWDTLSYSQIMTGTGIASRATISKCINGLEEMSLIVCVSGKDKREPNTYYLNTNYETSSKNELALVQKLNTQNTPINKYTKKESTKEKKNQQETDIPPNLSVQNFLDTWDEFKEHRKQIKKPMTPLAEKKMLKKLSGFNADDAVLALNTSIENGWIGVFPKEEKWIRQPNVAADGGVSSR